MNISFTTSRYIRCCAALVVILFSTGTSTTAQTSPQGTPPAPQAPLNNPPAPQALPTPQPSPTPSLERQFFKNILRDQRAIWTSPLRVRGHDARYLATLGFSTAALIATDRRTAGELDNDEERLEVSRDVSTFGSFYATGGTALAFYLVGRVRDDARARETGLLGTEALIDTGIVTSVLKGVTRRPRPRMEGGRGRFFDEGNSFPSGHAASAWALATVVANEYRDRRWVRYGAYGLATAVSISRFTGRNHFLSDVLVGSAIGYGIGRYVYGKHHDLVMDSQSGEATMCERSKWIPLITPRFNGGERRARSYGAMLVWSF